MKMLFKRLNELESKGKPIIVGCNGAGWMGEGFVAAVKHVPGMRIGVLSDSDPQKSLSTLIEFGGLEESAIVVTEDHMTANQAVSSGKTVVCTDPVLAASLDAIDVVTDVTPSPASGVHVAYWAILNKKDVVLINIEADVTVGSYLKKLAKENLTLYSVSSGDEPGCLMELWDFVQCMGYEPIVIGKGKNNPLNIEATPETVRESAIKDNKDPFQVASYVDGTKTMFELCCVANATGYKPMKPGMFGPKADLSNVTETFALEEDGGITKFPGAVDYVAGSEMSGGVFITVRVPDQRICEDLHYLKVGTGPYFTFFRPYHLWFLEAPISIARAVLDRYVTLDSQEVPVADVMTVAKKDMSPGDMIDEFGGYCCRGVILDRQLAREKNALPMGLSPGATLVKDIKKGETITWDHVSLDENSTVVKLRREQDKTF
jgi:predicted homoserine dehydrogenase-like protein